MERPQILGDLGLQPVEEIGFCTSLGSSSVEVLPSYLSELMVDIPQLSQPGNEQQVRKVDGEE